MAFDIDGARKAGYSDAEIADHLAEQQKFDVAAARKAGYGDADIIGHLSSKQAAKLGDYERKPGSAPERFARGAGEPAMGFGQLQGKVIGAVGEMLPDGNLARLMRAYGKFQGISAQDYRAKQEAIAPEGVDVARAAGNIVGTLPLASSGGTAWGATSGAAAKQSLASLAATGAATGAITGAVTPTDEDGFGVKKALQIGGGAVGGAVMTPLAAKGIDLINAGASKAFNALRGTFSPKMTAADVKQAVTSAMQAEGVDVASLGQQYVDDITNQVASALKAGGKLDQRTLGNLAAARSVGVNLTRGQATRDPSQYGNELFLRQAPGGEDLATGYAQSLSTLNSRLTGVQNAVGKPTLDVQAGQKALDALRAADAPVRARVDQAYDAARASLGMDAKLDQRALVDNTFTALQEAGVLDKLPGQFTNTLNQLSKGKGELTMREAQMMIRAANSRLSNSSDPVEKLAIRTFKSQLDDVIDAAGTSAGKDTADAFRLARSAAAARFKKMDEVPALKQALDDELAPDDFMAKVIYRSKLDELKKTRAFLRSNNRDAWNQLRAQVVDDLRQAATNGSDEPTAFRQAAFNKALKGLEDSGKLGVLFGPSEISTLRTIGRVGRLVQEDPPGVSRTGLSGAAKATGMLMQLASKIPGGGQTAAIAAGLVKRGGNSLGASMAQQQPSLAVPPAALTFIPQDAARLGGVAAAPLLDE